MSAGGMLRAFEWHDGELYLHTDQGFSLATVLDAARELNDQVLAYLILRKIVVAHVNTRGIVVQVPERALADEIRITGYRLRSSIRWSEKERGGTLFFEKVSND